jgi:hypothetical protein
MTARTSPNRGLKWYQGSYFFTILKITLLGLCVCACLCVCLPLEIQNCSLYSWNVPIVATKSGTCFLNRKHQETLRPTKPGCTCNVKRLDAFLWVLSLIMIFCLIIDSDSGAPQSTNLHGCRNMPKGSQKWWVYGCGRRMPWFCTARRSSWGLNFSYFDFIIFIDLLWSFWTCSNHTGSKPYPPQNKSPP